MIQIAFVKEVFRGMPHVVAIQNNGTVQTKALTEFGKHIVSDAGSIRGISDGLIPDGFIFTGFTPATKEHESILNSIFSDIDYKNAIGNDAAGFVSRTKIKSSKQAIEIVDMPLRKASLYPRKNVVVAFKARAFRASRNRTKISQQIKSGALHVDVKGAKLRPSYGNKFAIEISKDISTKYGAGFVRRAIKSLSSNGYASSSRRAMRRANAISAETSSTRENDANITRFTKATIGRK